jgi:Limonene-1,2-epoxide hydrolase
MTSNSEIVSRFCEAFARMNADELAAYFHEDAVYHNMPMAPLNGRGEIHANFVKLTEKFARITFETLHQVESGRLVFNERIDYMTIGTREVVLPVAGVFEIDGGLIRAWRDYFDLTPLRAPAV